GRRRAVRPPDQRGGSDVLALRHGSSVAEPSGMLPPSHRVARVAWDRNPLKPLLFEALSRLVAWLHVDSNCVAGACGFWGGGISPSTVLALGCGSVARRG